MKKWILITAAVMFVAGLALGGAFVVLAQGNVPPKLFGGPGGWMMGGRGMTLAPALRSGPFGGAGVGYDQPFTGTVPYGPGGMMRGWGYGRPFTGSVPFGRGMGGGPMSEMHQDIWTAVAQELGLTSDQLQAELATKTLAQLAQEKGVELEKLQEVAQSAWKAEINDLVQAGKLTREQADWMIQRMDAAGLPMLGLGQGACPCGRGGIPGGPGGQGFCGGRGRGPG